MFSIKQVNCTSHCSTTQKLPFTLVTSEYFRFCLLYNFLVDKDTIDLETEMPV